MSSETPHGGGPDKTPLPTPAKKMPAINIERRGDRLYEVNNLHKWFAISSLLMFGITIAMVFQDYARQWKVHQREFNRLSIEQTQADMNQAAGAIDRARFDQLNQQLSQTEAQNQQNEAQIEQIQDRIDDFTAGHFRFNQNFLTQKAHYDAEKYEYEEALARKASNADRLHEGLLETERVMNEYKAEVERLSIELRNAQTELNKFIGERDKLERDREAMLTEYTRLQTRLSSLDPGLIVTSFRNAPLIDFLNPSERIRQMMIPNLFYEHPFKPIPRVDRCTTCHLGIDQKGFENAEQPYRTHPNMELYLAASSPHPVETFGCTTCHAGLDRAVDFQTAGHMPRSAEQRAQWEEEYHWHEEHYLETPMHPMPNIEAGCFKCHNGSVEVPRANVLNNGRDLIRIYGCFGCHKIPGYEGVRKVGPDLTAVSGKLTKDWVRKWLANPKEFKSEARMPQFWWNSNNSGKTGNVDYDKRNVAEINAITEYLWSKAQPKQLPAGRTGNAADGKALVESVGCFGCHAIGPIQEAQNQTQTRRKHGYNLANQGSKVTAAWIYNWVRDPRQVWSESKMPSLRLTEQEAADVTSYLSSLKNPEFEAKAVPGVEEAAVDEVALELLRNNSTDIEARERLKTMNLEQKNLFVGERLISRYGCFGCHTVPGFENAQPIGTELTEAGSKLISQLDFGFLDIEHSRRAWYSQKLHDPRIFDVGRVKRPEELLKMPNFKFSDAEADSITMVLTSLVRETVPLEMRDRTTDAVAKGRLLVAEKNCRGCHIVEGAGGDIRPTFKDQALAPPNLATQGWKTQPSWLHPFLKDPSRVRLRPWLTARMPTFHFTEEEAATIGRYFSTVDNVEYPFISTDIADANAERLRVGAELFTALKCSSCHPQGNQRPPGREDSDLAPDLQLASERLRPDWVLEWILDPQRIMPGTKMPMFFSPDQSGKITTPYPNILGGDAKAQIQAVRDHLFLTVGRGRRTSSD